MNQLIHPDCHPFTAAGNLKQVSAFYEEGRRVMWMMLRAQPRPCFNHELIDEIMTLARAAKDSGLPIDFWVTGSLVPQIYNVGGDLNFFAEAIRTGRREALRAYARACVDCVHAATRGFDTGAVSLAMIEGTALGGVASRRRWRTTSCWRRTTPAWAFPKWPSTCSRAWAAIRWWRGARA